MTKCKFNIEAVFEGFPVYPLSVHQVTTEQPIGRLHTESHTLNTIFIAAQKEA